MALLDSREKGCFWPETTDVRIARSVLLLALFAAVAQGAEVYRSKNADGGVVYSDRPTNESSEAVTTVTTPHGNNGQAAPAQRQGRATGARASSDAPPEAPAKPAPLSGPTSTDLRAERQKNCDVAKERQQRYDLSRRLFKTNDKGEREYLDDKAVAEAKAKAAQDVKDWCG